MWEYRIFNERPFKKELPSEIDFSDSEPEVRIDYYYDFQQPQYGLKERLSQSNTEAKPKLELKIRYDRTSPLGVEYWNKVISHEYPIHRNTHLPMYQIDDILSQYTEEEDFGSDVEYFQQSAGSLYKITEITKTRWETVIYVEDLEIDVEYVELQIEDQIIYGFSIEAEYLEIVEFLIKEWDLDQAQFVGGYPTLVKAVNELLEIQSTPLL